MASILAALSLNVYLANIQPGASMRQYLRKARQHRLLRPRSFGRFAVVGCLNTMMGVGNFPVLYWLLHRVLSVNALLVLGWIISTGFAFLLHKLFTFKSTGAYHAEGGKFLVLSLATLGINLAVMNIVTSLTSASPVLVAVATSTILSAVLMLLSYLGMNHLVFRK